MKRNSFLSLQDKPPVKQRLSELDHEPPFDTASSPFFRAQITSIREYRHILDCRTISGKIQYLVDWLPTWLDESSVALFKQAVITYTNELGQPRAMFPQDLSNTSPVEHESRERLLSVCGNQSTEHGSIATVSKSIPEKRVFLTVSQRI